MNDRRDEWIAMMEAGYRLEKDDRVWLTGVMDRLGGVLDGGEAAVGWMGRRRPDGAVEEVWALGPRRNAGLRERLAAARWPALAVDARAGPAVASREDLLLLQGPAGPDAGFCIALPATEERRRCLLLASHLGIALRARLLCRAPEKGAPSLAGGELREAVLRLDGQHAAGSEEGAVRWEELLGGRWSLLDGFERDGRRFVVAVRNEAAHPDPRRLTQRERQVAELAGQGRSSKEIAYALGISTAAVTNCTTRVQKKLGLARRTELVAYFSLHGLRRALQEVRLQGERLLVGSFPLVDEGVIAVLSEAERDIVSRLAAGSTNADIALCRGSSLHTVANQLQSVFRKLGARSRGELLARVRSWK